MHCVAWSLEPLAPPLGASTQVCCKHSTLPYSPTHAQNLYASKQYYDPALAKGTINQIDPALLTYDFENPDAWEAFVRPEIRAEGKPAGS